MTVYKFMFLELTWLGILDIFVVAGIIYSILSIIRGTRALSMVLGLFIILLIAFVSTWLKMETLNWIIAKLGAVWIIAFLIVFQPELRNVLTSIGNTPPFKRITQTKTMVGSIEDINNALRILKGARTGALIILQRDVGLKNIISTGKAINAKLTPELLVTLFAPYTPLHDGAVVIDNDTIVAAACQLPLTDNPKYQMELGMRHRAAVGMSEQTDAAVLIVSEETGEVSLALRGHLRRDLNFETLNRLLDVVLSK